MTNKNPNKLRKYGSIIATLACLAVFIYAAQGLFATVMDYYNNRKVLNNLQETFYDAEKAEQNGSKDGAHHIRPGFGELLKQNPDVVGWITIDGTQIDYPILQAEDNREYLDKNFYKDTTRAGSIFLDYRNTIDTLGANTIVYGHRMKDGSMFQHLTKYKNKDFFKKYPTFDFDTLYDSYKAEIFAVYSTTTDFNYIQTEFSTEEEYEQLLAKIQAESEYDTGVKVSGKDRILTLSTCDYDLDDQEGRLVVQAKLVKKM